MGSFRAAEPQWRTLRHANSTTIILLLMFVLLLCVLSLLMLLWWLLLRASDAGEPLSLDKRSVSRILPRYCRERAGSDFDVLIPSLPAAPARHSHLASSSFYVSPIATLSASCPARPRMLLVLWLVFVLWLFLCVLLLLLLRCELNW